MFSLEAKLTGSINAKNPYRFFQHEGPFGTRRLHLVHAISLATQQLVAKEKDKDVIGAPILVHLDLQMSQVFCQAHVIPFL
jgi:hypothetical protein